MLKYYYGCMASGKSLHLLATAHNFEEKKISFVVIKSEIDNRDGIDIIHSRALGDRECVSVKPTTNIYKLITTLLNINNATLKPQLKWILVDEAQFLTYEQVNQLAALTDNFNINIICYGLRTDFKTNLFEGSKRLFEIADSIEEIKSQCSCDRKTHVNARIDKCGDIITEGQQVEVGGDDRYVSMCRKCYYEKINNPLYIRKKE
jgi:thymidine kinase